MIGAARALAKVDERPNNVLMIFQPAEEGGAGGRKMCEDGVLCGKVLGNPADVIFGLHGFPMLTVGQMATRTGPLLASADQFIVTVRGKGGHAAMPHFGIDPIVVGEPYRGGAAVDRLAQRLRARFGRRHDRHDQGGQRAQRDP